MHLWGLLLFNRLLPCRHRPIGLVPNNDLPATG